MTDCIGLDIGRTAIKAVRFRRGLTGRETVQYFHQKLPIGAEGVLDEAKTAELLRAFVKRYHLDRIPVITSLACRELFLRTLSLPFSDASKVAQVAPFEMESLIPLPLEEVAVGCIVFGEGSTQGSTQRGASDVLVAAAPRATVADHLKLLSTVGIDPAQVQVDALALFAVTEQLRREGADVPADLAIIDMGASKTTLCLTHQGRPRLLRTILWGGDRITEALAEKYECSRAEAERRKRSLTAQQAAPWMAPLIKEVQLTLHAYEAATQTRLRKCWLSGGGAKVPEIAAYLAAQLELEPVGPREGFGADCPRVFSVAFGLAVRLGSARRVLRFRRPEPTLALDFKQASIVAPVSDAAGKRDLQLAALGILAIMVLGFADLSVRSTLKESRLRDLKAALQAQFQKSFGTAASPGSEVEQAKAMLTRTEKTLALLGATQSPVVPTLAELTRRLPKTIPLKVIALTVEQGTIQIEAETTSFDAVEKIKQALAGSPGFKDVAVSDARVGAQPAQVLFRVSMTVTAS
jgi:general secretion pathway protein L